MDTLHDNKRFFSIFIFPFKYSAQGTDERLTPEFMANLFSHEPSPWEQGDYEIKADGENEHLKYNEWNYFHPYVRKMLFSRKGADANEMRYLVRKDYTSFSVQCATDNFLTAPPIHLSMRVNSIDLHLFENQIGMLSITMEMRNPREYTFDELLLFNDTARRVYPPFLGEKNEKYGHTFEPKEKKLIPLVVTLNSANGKLLQETYTYDSLKKKARINTIISTLLQPLVYLPDADQNNVGRPGTLKYLFEPFTDDRMFVVSYCENESLSKQWRKPCCGQLNYTSESRWYSYIFVDGSPGGGVGNEAFKADLIRRHTYARWAEYGTFTGMSRYSFVMLNEGSSYVSFLYDHCKGVYYQMALMILFQRAMLLKFSEEVKDLTAKVGSQLDYPKTSDLYFRFIRFTNRYWHSEVTPQEQGIEIYSQWMGLVNHDRLYDDVKEEIEGLAEYLRNEIGHRTETEIARITKIGFPISLALLALTVAILLPTLWLAHYGDKTLPPFGFGMPYEFTWYQWILGAGTLLSVILSMCSVLWAMFRWRKFRSGPTKQAEVSATDAKS